MDLRRDHSRLLERLKACEAASAQDRPTRMRELWLELEPHLEQKGALYRQLKQAAERGQDQGRRTLIELFERNMTLVNDGLRQFFVVPCPPAEVERRFGLMAQVLRSRLEAEETALIPLVKKLIPDPERAA